MQKAYPVCSRLFSSVKDSQIFQKTKEFLTIHETYVQHTRYVPEGSTTDGFRYPAPGSHKMAVIPTTDDTDKYYKNDIVERDTREMGREIHVILSEQMKSLPEDIQMEYITQYSLKGDNDKLFEHKNVAVKDTDMNNWWTMDQEKVNEKLFDQLPTQLPHPFWEEDAGKIVEDYESKGLPPCPGKMYQWETPKEMEDGLW